MCTASAEFNRVPPQASASGLDAGKSACCKLSLTPSEDPLSPAAMQTGIPSAAASIRKPFIDVMAWVVWPDSGPPQLIEIAHGVTEASAAVLTASMNP